MRPISAKRLKWMAQAACLASGFFVAAPGACFAIGQEKYVENEKHAGDFALVREERRQQSAWMAAIIPV